MKQKPTLFGQAFQISELRQQVAELQEQNRKLTADIKALRDLDRKIFDDQEAMIDELKALVKDYHVALIDVREGRTLKSDCAFALEKRMRVFLEGEMRG